MVSTARSLLGPGRHGQQCYNCSKNICFIIIITGIGLLPGGSGYFTRKQNKKLVTTKFKSGKLHEKHVGNRSALSIAMELLLLMSHFVFYWGFL